MKLWRWSIIGRLFPFSEPFIKMFKCVGNEQKAVHCRLIASDLTFDGLFFIPLRSIFRSLIANIFQRKSMIKTN